MSATPRTDAIRAILTGIDQTEIEEYDGWWETSTGARFGAEKLAAVMKKVSEIEHQNTAMAKELLSMSKFLDTMADCDFSAHYKAGFRNAAELCRKAVKTGGLTSARSAEPGGADHRSGA